MSENGGQGDVVLFGAGEREQACSVARRTFLRAETVPSPQLRKEPRFLKAGQTELGGGGCRSVFLSALLEISTHIP